MILLYACIAILVVFVILAMNDTELAGVVIVFILIGAASYIWAVCVFGAKPIGP